MGESRLTFKKILTRLLALIFSGVLILDLLNIKHNISESMNLSPSIFSNTEKIFWVLFGFIAASALLAVFKPRLGALFLLLSFVSANMAKYFFLKTYTQLPPLETPDFVHFFFIVIAVSLFFFSRRKRLSIQVVERL